MNEFDPSLNSSGEPQEENNFLASHIDLLCDSYRRVTGRELTASDGNSRVRAHAIWLAPFIVASHGTQADPIFNYANRSALALWEMDWTTFTQLPSRYSAEPVAREERERLLAAVTAHGFIDNYSGVRVTASGRRFRIEHATVWNLIGTEETFHGQAVVFEHFNFLSEK